MARKWSAKINRQGNGCMLAFSLIRAHRSPSKETAAAGRVAAREVAKVPIPEHNWSPLLCALPKTFLIALAMTLRNCSTCLIR